MKLVVGARVSSCLGARPLTDLPSLSALVALDDEIAKSKNLRAVAPLRLLSAGGFVAVGLFRNRDTPEDIDYILDPATKNVEKVKRKLQRAIQAVSNAQAIHDEWINSRMEIFAVGEANKKRLFQDSVRQGTVLWQGKNLIIYAAKWEWALARKIKRIGSQKREVDVSDAVELLGQMVRDHGGPLPYELIKSWDTIVYTPLDDAAIGQVAEQFIARFGYTGVLYP